PVSKLIESIFEEAVQLDASDIHIEPDRDVLRIRLRVDGVLQEQVMNEKKIISPLILRLKLMSKLNISEKRIPQDGRFTITIHEKRFDVRVSTMPVQYGESMVMRLLPQTGNVSSLDSLDMPPETLKLLKHHITRPHGMVLVTGPTGSGKSTTLYACLAELNSPENKIITVEDPVEYQLPRISQVQVQTKIDLTFARVLRACLRQDPDVLMVGEIRDDETAEIALRAALTGHMVLSTLHTNDAVSAPVRLVDMGIEPFLVASALHLVIAQRLVRKICAHCVEDYTPTDSENILIKGLMKKELTGYTFKKGRGCAQCNKTGYKGRIGVYELLEFDQELSDILRTGDTQKFVATARQRPNYKSLGQLAFEYAAQGKTTLEEVIHTAGDLESEQPIMLNPVLPPEEQPIAPPTVPEIPTPPPAPEIPAPIVASEISAAPSTPAAPVVPTPPVSDDTKPTGSNS
ncbi:MAG: GspE/PulE family protein, partial [Pseudomonadota bacterium]